MPNLSQKLDTTFGTGIITVENLSGKRIFRSALEPGGKSQEEIVKSLVKNKNNSNFLEVFLWILNSFLLCKSKIKINF